VVSATSSEGVLVKYEIVAMTEIVVNENFYKYNKLCTKKVTNLATFCSEAAC